MTDKVRLAPVGLGRWARVLARGAQRGDLIDLHSCFSRDEAKRADAILGLVLLGVAVAVDRKAGDDRRRRLEVVALEAEDLAGAAFGEVKFVRGAGRGAGANDDRTGVVEAGEDLFPADGDAESRDLEEGCVC